MPRPIMNRLICLAFSLVFCTAPAIAQAHYALADSSSINNMIIVILWPVMPTINGSPIETGDEIGVFDSVGQCFGRAKWKANDSVTIIVWGSDPLTGKKGFDAGAPFRFRIWDSSKGREAIAKATYDRSTVPFVDTSFANNAFCKLASLKGTYAGVKTGAQGARSGQLFAFRNGLLTYSLPHAARVQITLFDLRGRSVFSLARTDQPGFHQLSLTNRDRLQGCFIGRFSALAHTQEMPVFIGN